MEAERFARARELHTLVDHLPDVVVRYDLQLRRTYPVFADSRGMTKLSH
jgi:hypothetical protein